MTHIDDATDNRPSHTPTSGPVFPPGARGRRIGIVGAGVGGLSAAIALRQAGFEVRVFERHQEVRGLGGAILLNAIGIHILRGFGCAADDLYTASVTKFKNHRGDTRVLWTVDPDLLRQADVTGWQSGMMRSEVYERLLSAIPDGTILTGHELASCRDSGEQVALRFTNGAEVEVDLLVGADGIDSVVRTLLFGESEKSDLNIRAWLSWSHVEGLPRDEMVLSHDDRHQIGYAPLRYRGADCFEWWFLEPCTPDTPRPADPLSYIRDKAETFADPVPRIVGATAPGNEIIQWELRGRPALTTWSRGRVTLLGDACHPTSPYAGYGAGMALEDGFFLGQYLAGIELSDRSQLAAGLRQYEDKRLAYTNRVTVFARRLGSVFHWTPRPLRPLRDFVLDRRWLERRIDAGYTGDAQELLRSVLEAEARGTRRRRPVGPA